MPSRDLPARPARRVPVILALALGALLLAAGFLAGTLSSVKLEILTGTTALPSPSIPANSDSTLGGRPYDNWRDIGSGHSAGGGESATGGLPEHPPLGPTTIFEGASHQLRTPLALGLALLAALFVLFAYRALLRRFDRRGRPWALHRPLPRLLVGCVLVVGSLALTGPRLSQTHGTSMAPTIRNEDIILYEPLSPRLGWLLRGDIIIFSTAGMGDDALDLRLVKRVIGIPGDIIELANRRVYLNGRELRENYVDGAVATTPKEGEPTRFFLGPDQYFVLGDGRVGAIDSRELGPIPTEAIIGRLLLLMRAESFR